MTDYAELARAVIESPPSGLMADREWDDADPREVLRWWADETARLARDLTQQATELSTLRGEVERAREYCAALASAREIAAPGSYSLGKASAAESVLHLLSPAPHPDTEEGETNDFSLSEGEAG